MLPCPVQNKGILKGLAWIQKRPRVSQRFGLNPQIYQRFGMEGHNGVDYGIPVGTPIFSPIEGEVSVKNSGKKGYGLHVKIRSRLGKEVVLAHLSKVFVKNGEYIRELDKIGLSGNTGFSTGPHLHYGFRAIHGRSKDIWSWKVVNHDNGYYGYFDILPFTFNWKGTEDKNTL